MPAGCVLKALAMLRHSGAFNQTVVEHEMRQAGFSFEEEAPGGIQRCLLERGDVLWMPSFTAHDVFSLDSPSVAINMRFLTLTADGFGDEKAEL